MTAISRQCSTSLLAFFIAAGSFASTSVLAADFYVGKQVTLIAGSAPGGGFDQLARLVSRHIGRHIPGAPSVVVQNMPAAGSMVATNLLFNTSPRDGTFFGIIQRGMLLAKLTMAGQVQFDLGKFNWLGSLNSETAVSLANASSPFMTAKDLFDKELVVGGETNVDPEITPRLYNDLLGTKFKIVNGYNGTTEIGLAMERGEVQGIGDWSWSSLKVQHADWLRDKKVRVLLQGALTKNPELPDVPEASSFAKGDLEKRTLQLFFTQKTVARPMLMPPGVPADRVAIMRDAFMALGKDAEFLADAEKSKLEIGLISGPDVEKAIALITSASPEVTGRYIKALENR
jgi:tripartite-type tricarboxylate transporter receptor subunit TctC